MKVKFIQNDDTNWCVHDADSDAHAGTLTHLGGRNWRFRGRFTEGTSVEDAKKNQAMAKSEKYHFDAATYEEAQQNVVRLLEPVTPIVRDEDGEDPAMAAYKMEMTLPRTGIDTLNTHTLATLVAINTMGNNMPSFMRHLAQTLGILIANHAVDEESYNHVLTLLVACIKEVGEAGRQRKRDEEAEFNKQLTLLMQQMAEAMGKEIDPENSGALETQARSVLQGVKSMMSSKGLELGGFAIMNAGQLTKLAEGDDSEGDMADKLHDALVRATNPEKKVH